MGEAKHAHTHTHTQADADADMKQILLCFLDHAAAAATAHGLQEKCQQPQVHQAYHPLHQRSTPQTAMPKMPAVCQAPAARAHTPLLAQPAFNGYLAANHMR